LVENRHGLIVEAEVFKVNGTAERDAALVMLEQIPGKKPVTVGGDKGFDTFGFVAECRNLGVVPHVAQNQERRGGSAIDGRTRRHPGYAANLLDVVLAIRICHLTCILGFHCTASR
jgi:hypothetical protein